MFQKRCEELKIEFDFENTKIVAVGNKTALVCEKNHIPLNIIPQKFSSSGVIEELINYDLKNKLVFIPRSAIGKEELPAGLAALGAEIKTAPVYNISLPSEEKIKSNIEILNKKTPDLFIFTSSVNF